MVDENPGRSGGLAGTFLMDPITTAVKAILCRSVWVSGRFYVSFLSKQAPEGQLAFRNYSGLNRHLAFKSVQKTFKQSKDKAMVP